MLSLKFKDCVAVLRINLGKGQELKIEIFWEATAIIQMKGIDGLNQRGKWRGDGQILDIF